MDLDTVPWVDKYRPRRLNQIIEQTEVVKILKESMKSNNLPHLLLYGSPGSGKTSTVLALAYELYGAKFIDERVIELNASDDRGINVVREKIITFSKTCVGNSDPKFPSPPYKLVILDESDLMTEECQMAMRQVIETYSHITRFCFICNYIDKISEPIASRCIKLRFKPLTKDFLAPKLADIAKKEHVLITDDAINAIVKTCEGDARRAIMLLQYASYMNNKKKEITAKHINYISGDIEDKDIDDIWDKCTKENIQGIHSLTMDIIRHAYPIAGLLEKLRVKIKDSKLSEIKKSLITIQLGKTEVKLLTNGNEYIQLLNFLIQTNNIIKSK
uniref:AAA+ ATPase domain-containing protein n=1 Tax=viral metagenome TaxID=1070528 RepID=A0A6C0EAB8_9ZZZZ